MPVCFPVVLSLPLILATSTPRADRVTWSNIPASLVPALPGIALGPEPRIRGVSRGISPLRSALFTSAATDVSPCTFSIHLTGLLRNVDEVVVYLDGERVGAGLAAAAEWTLTCECSGRPRQGTLHVWVYREGHGPIPLAAVLLCEIP